MKTAVAMGMLLIGMLTVYGGDLRFRSGRIVAAELSQTLPAVADADQYTLPPEKKKGTGAAVVLELTPGRMISIHDYLLQVNGREHPAVALRVGDGSFSGKLDAVSSHEGERITLLYIIPSGLAAGKDAELTLIPAAEPRTQSCKLCFTHLGHRSFTTPSRIGKEGNLK